MMDRRARSKKSGPSSTRTTSTASRNDLQKDELNDLIEYLRTL